MTEHANREPARDPQDLERLLIARQHAGDVEGMVALFEPQALVDCGEGRFLRGHQEIRPSSRSSRADGSLRAASNRRR